MKLFVKRETAEVLFLCVHFLPYEKLKKQISFTTTVLGSWTNQTNQLPLGVSKKLCGFGLLVNQLVKTNVYT